MMPASKHGDPQLGIDIHFCTVPPSPSPVPLPTPHISIVFDPFDYVPFIGGTVTVCGMKRATAGTPVTNFVVPPGIKLVDIDPLSGQLATPNCSYVIREAFLEGDEPTTTCPLHPGPSQQTSKFD